MFVAHYTTSELETRIASQAVDQNRLAATVLHQSKVLTQLVDWANSQIQGAQPASPTSTSTTGDTESSAAESGKRKK